MLQINSGNILREKGITTKNSFKDGRKEGKNGRKKCPVIFQEGTKIVMAMEFAFK